MAVDNQITVNEMMKNKGFIVLIMSVFLLTGCESLQGMGQKEKIGSAAGAILGGIAGSKVGSGSGTRWAVGAGALLGAVMGGEVGRSLDKADMAYANRALGNAHAAPIGDTITWNNPESGNEGSYTPVRDGYAEGGSYCREYQQNIYIDGERHTGYGTACQQADGTWKIVNE